MGRFDYMFIIVYYDRFFIQNNYRQTYLKGHLYITYISIKGTSI